MTNQTTEATSDAPTERWRRIEPRIREQLELDEVEIKPPALPKILAKICTRETENGKGLFLLGPTGTGKSRRLKWMAENFEIRIVDAITLSLQLAEAHGDYERMEILNLVPPRWSERPQRVCDLIIDDLGTEEDVYNVYGTPRHLMIEAIIARYNWFPKFKTHFTCNLTKEVIRARYGERIWSRLNEMVTFVTLAGEDRRMRKV